MSKVAPVFAVGCGIIASISGAASGGRHSIVLASVGACVGLVLGIASYFGVVIPYVGWLIWHDKTYHPTPRDNPPRLWALFFLPAMFATLVLAALLPWIVIGLFVSGGAAVLVPRSYVLAGGPDR
jgi:hypothetical protein